MFYPPQNLTVYVSVKVRYGRVVKSKFVANLAEKMAATLGKFQNCPFDKNNF